MLRLELVQYFVEIAESRSFTIAAKRLGIQKSTVSRGLASLEDRLGVRLIHRNTRHVALTEDGAVYFAHCRKAMREAECAEAELSRRRVAPKGCLRLGATTEVFDAFLAPLLGDFLSRYPELRLELSVHSGTMVVDPLASKLDVLVQGGPVKNSMLFVKHLGNIQQGLYCSPSYEAVRGLPSLPHELTVHSCVAVGTGDESPVWEFRVGEKQERIVLAPLRVAVAADDPMVRMQLVEAGVGIAVLPSYLARPLEQQRRLIRVLPQCEMNSLSMYALYPTPLKHCSKLRAFFQWLRPHLPERFTDISHNEALSAREASGPDVLPFELSGLPQTHLVEDFRASATSPGGW